MFRIAIICILLSFLKSGKCNVNITDLQQLKVSFTEARQYIENEVRKEEEEEEDAAIIIGMARAGKSTLINYLIGTPMIASRTNKYDSMRIRKLNKSDKGPEIGHTVKSTTSKPTRWVASRLSNMAIWDTPGFGDNRGDVADITNAFYLFQLLKHVKSIKIVVVANIIDIEATNIQNFTNLLEYLCKLLGNEIENAFESVSMIFTQYQPRDAEGRSYSFLKEYVERMFRTKIIDSSLSMSTNSRRLIDYLTENLNHVGFFNKMSKKGTNISEADVGIISAIQAAKSIPKSSLQSVHPSISDNSKNNLHNALNNLTSFDEVKRLNKILREDISNQTTVVDNLAQNKTKEKIETIIKRLDVFRNSMYDCLSETCNLTTIINLTQSYSNKLADEIKKTNFTEKVELINLLGYILDSVLIESYKKVFSSLIWSTNYQVTEIIYKLQLQIRNITKTEYEKEEEEQRNKYTQEIKRLVHELKDLKEKNPKEKDYINNSFFTLCNIALNYIKNNNFFNELNNIYDMFSNQTSITTIPDDEDLC